jgi:hypothetical protein
MSNLTFVCTINFVIYFAFFHPRFYTCFTDHYWIAREYHWITSWKIRLPEITEKRKGHHIERKPSPAEHLKDSLIQRRLTFKETLKKRVPEYEAAEYRVLLQTWWPVSDLSLRQNA